MPGKRSPDKRRTGRPQPGRKPEPPAGEQPRSERAAAATGALVSRRAADRLRSGHVWVYASEIESITLPETGPADPPALLPVADNRGLLLGTALYSPSSQIALRMVARQAIDEPAWLRLLAERLRRPSPGASRCWTRGATPAAFASAKPTSCPAWSWTSTAG